MVLEKSTVGDIKKNKTKILEYVSSGDKAVGSRKTLKLSAYPAMEKSLYTWFLQERSRGTPLSGDILCEKAKFFLPKKLLRKTTLKQVPDGSKNSKKRFGIRQLTVSGELLSSDFSAVEPFKEKLKKKIKELNLTSDQLYNADESGLFWRLLPNKTSVHSGEKSAPGRKISKERITFMPCANASGSHKLRLFVLGKAKKPRAFANSSIPVSYKGQRKAWVTQDIFSEWFHSEFVPDVRRKLKQLNLSPTALLILDNAPGHPDELISDDNKISVMFLPANCTPILQPMDQHVIQAVKLFYRKKLLKTIVESDEDIPQTLKRMNLKDVVYALDEAWQQVNPELIKKSWTKLLPSSMEDNPPSLLNDDDEDDIPLSLLLKKMCENTIPIDLRDEMDDVITLTKKLKKIFQMVKLRNGYLAMTKFSI
ncbi:hypothetical protein NQ314_013219 [Rhamnusium bicolor]|uniref:Uncharacterized protein n=1 Tax=Rhamnusium bicolor TaxID=1586634 RepID=A0AAV8X747_9CUCU|nr:hypothetical protein NQ314_013219 [Rhamnusium bicolor]